MWFEVFEWLGGAWNAYRAFQDSGGWVLQMDMPYIQHYMESFIDEKGAQ